MVGRKEVSKERMIQNLRKYREGKKKDGKKEVN